MQTATRGHVRPTPAISRLALVALPLVVCFLLSVSALSPASARAAVVRVVLFYSPACPHCHTLIRDDLPPIMNEYGDRLLIAAVDASDPAGTKLFRAAVTEYDVPAQSRGVPAVVVGDQFVAGTTDISQRLPILVSQYLSQGGAGWPTLSGLSSTLSAPGALVTSSPAALLGVMEPSDGVLDRLARDRWGNTAALVVLGGMLAVVGTIVWRAVTSRRASGAWPSIDAGRHSHRGLRASAPYALIVLGLAISGYLAYVTVTDSTVLCGPVGSCTIVQQSTYSRLFGVLPVAYLGLTGYVLIAAAFAVSRISKGTPGTIAAFALFLLTLGGTVFSIYLTVLEPFVIGATCLWCLGSAVIMTLLLVLSASDLVPGEPSEATRPVRDVTRDAA